MRLWHDEDGAAPIEGLMGGLLLLSWFMVAYQFYDAFRLRAMVSNASYVVADLVSRQKGAIGPQFVEGTKKIFDQITRVESSDRSWLRLTLISCPATSTDTRACDGIAKGFRMDNSFATGTHEVLTQATLDAREGNIPVMAAGDSAVLLETRYNYWPIFDIGDKTITLDGKTPLRIGLSSMLTFHEFVVTRPRGPRTVWSAEK